MEANAYREIQDSLRQLYVDDPRPWLVGYSGGKDSTMVASLVFDAVLSVPPEQRKKPIAVICTDTRVEAELDETPRGQGGKPNPWGNDPECFRDALYKPSRTRRRRRVRQLHANASNGECPIQIDTSTPADWSLECRNPNLELAFAL